MDSNCFRPVGVPRSLGSWFLAGFGQWEALVGNWLVGGTRVFLPLLFSLGEHRDCISPYLLLLDQPVFKFQLLQ